MTERIRRTLRLDPELDRQVQELRWRLRMSFQGLTETALKEFLASHESPSDERERGGKSKRREGGVTRR